MILKHECYGCGKLRICKGAYCKRCLEDKRQEELAEANDIMYDLYD